MFIAQCLSINFTGIRSIPIFSSKQVFSQVIQRAEALDLSEQERVGRLVERLDNMKRNVCIVTSTRSNERRGCGSRCSGGARCVCSCALCGEKFAVLGASANLCKDCRKYICQKCGIEATRLNPLKGNGDGSEETTSSRSSLRVMRFAQERAGVQRHGNAQKQFLCRICAETREIWKKSGAWFFKGMPKYILPEKKVRGRVNIEFSNKSKQKNFYIVILNLTMCLNPLTTFEKDFKKILIIFLSLH